MSQSRNNQQISKFFAFTTTPQPHHTIRVKGMIFFLPTLPTECVYTSFVYLQTLLTQSSPAGPVTDPKVLIEGVLFRARYLGSTQLVCEGQPTKATRMMQAEEAVSRIKVNSDNYKAGE